jgi:hypothetical protein
MEPSDWKCPCGEINFKRRNNCRKCNNVKTTSRSMIEKKPGDWMCPNINCNEYNFQFRDICRKCNTSKITQHQKEEKEKNIIDEDDGINVCVICLDQPKTHAITKCGHLCYCEIYGFNINKCPICRETYNPDNDLLKIFSV